MSARTPVQVRHADGGDSSAILRCLREAFEPYRDQYTSEAFLDTTLTADTLADRVKTMAVFVAVIDQTVVGTIACGLVKNEGHLRGMAVLPERQGQGVAEALLLAAESDLRDRGCHRVTLDTTAPLQRAIRFYEKHGYRRSGVVRDFFGMPLYEYFKDLTG